jgi:hypothetical protein
VKAGVIWLLAIAGCASMLTSARPPSGVRPTFTLRVPIWTTASDADQPGALSLRTLTVQARGRRVVPDFLLGPDSDLFLLIALDLTGDVASAADAKDGLAAEIEKLPPRVYVSVLNCQDELRVLQEPTVNRARVVAAIQSVEVTGKAGLLNCIERVESVADAMLARSAVRVGVIFITDATIQNYREDLINPVINSSDPNDLSRRFPEQLVQNAMAALQRRMESSFAPLFIVQLSTQDDRWNEAYYDGLKTVVQNTLGEALFCATRAAIRDSVERSFARLRSHYSARIAVPIFGDSVVIDIQSATTDGPRLVYRSRFTLPAR